jgi:crossover junction endodeoxyribonuclease RuvC
MSPVCIVGVDPGRTGAVAFYSPDAPHLVTVDDVPVVGSEIDIPRLKRRLQQMRPTLAVIERVGSMPGQGVASTFKFGFAAGCIRGVVAGLDIPIELVSPTVWKRHFKLSADKEQSRALAVRYWPSCDGFGRKKDHGRAEAALIARYGAEVLLKGGGR